MTTLNLEGDEQSDLTVHGGVDKAVYVYPSEHYAYWRHELPGMDLPWGVFGENLTTEGLLEADVRIGDRFRVVRRSSSSRSRGCPASSSASGSVGRTS